MDSLSSTTILHRRELVAPGTKLPPATRLIVEDVPAASKCPGPSFAAVTGLRNVQESCGTELASPTSSANRRKRITWSEPNRYTLSRASVFSGVSQAVQVQRRLSASRSTRGSSPVRPSSPECKKGRLQRSIASQYARLSCLIKSILSSVSECLGGTRSTTSQILGIV